MSNPASAKPCVWLLFPLWFQLRSFLGHTLQPQQIKHDVSFIGLTPWMGTFFGVFLVFLEKTNLESLL
jgi:hypothetical protein